ncbi:hypothetical protein POM88_002539 [Heracleum sosnowskyi]|uniref:RRM domain-containing protein n=1 Tax=Heracleum sosnowskyi TaxID=360622 RepID=A0AAD8NAK6_9APIA|nr:hypothetical protein POM88_002539 [Heracleum sosnowskyi]
MTSQNMTECIGGSRTVTYDDQFLCLTFEEEPLMFQFPEVGDGVFEVLSTSGDTYLVVNFMKVLCSQEIYSWFMAGIDHLKEEDAAYTIGGDSSCISRGVAQTGEAMDVSSLMESNEGLRFPFRRKVRRMVWFTIVWNGVICRKCLREFHLRVEETAKVEANSSIAVFGLGAMGLAVVERARTGQGKNIGFLVMLLLLLLVLEPVLLWCVYMSGWEEVFQKYGKIDRVDMKSGFAFVYMEDEEDAGYAIRKLDDMEFGRKGRQPCV